MDWQTDTIALPHSLMWSLQRRARGTVSHWKLGGKALWKTRFVGRAPKAKQLFILLPMSPPNLYVLKILCLGEPFEPITAWNWIYRCNKSTTKNCKQMIIINFVSPVMVNKHRQKNKLKVEMLAYLKAGQRDGRRLQMMWLTCLHEARQHIYISYQVWK